MSAAVIDALDEVTTAINGHDWTPWSFAAVRSYLPVRRVEDVRDLTVEVCQPGERQSRIARGTIGREMRMSIGVTKQLGDDKQAEADLLMDLCDAMQQFLWGAAWSFGALESIEAAPTFHPKRYDQGIFTRVMVLTFNPAGVFHD